jgi:hypothetical protein
MDYVMSYIFHDPYRPNRMAVAFVPNPSETMLATARRSESNTALTFWLGAEALSD